MKNPTDLVEVRWTSRKGLVCETVRCLRRDEGKTARSLHDTYYNLVGGIATTTEVQKPKVAIKPAVQHHYEIVR
jgi:hypothetical protein